MSSPVRKKIVRLLGVGFDADDGHVRMTQGKKFDVLMGSDESHEYLTELIAKIEEELKNRNLELSDLDPDELSDIIKSIKS